MAVISAQLKAQREWQQDDSPKTSGKRTYLVHCSDKFDDPDLAAAAVPTLPWGGMKVTGRDVKEVGQPKTGALYEVTLDYSTKQKDPDRDEQNPDPTQRPCQLRLSFDSFEESIFRQKDSVPEILDGDGNSIAGAGGGLWKWGKSIVNTAGKPFPDGVKEVYRDVCITFTKNIETTNFVKIWNSLKDYLDAVNSDNFGITYRGQRFPIAAKTCWLADATSEPGFENNVQFEAVNLTFKIRADGWRRLILDQGTDEVGGPATDPNPNKTQPIRDVNGDPIGTPSLLNGKGKKLVPPAVPVFLKFRTKNEKPFKALPFDEIR